MVAMFFLYIPLNTWYFSCSVCFVAIPCNICNNIFLFLPQTHSLGNRRAVPGRKKGFDVLLAEHKSKTREKELLRQAEQQQLQTPALREPHPSPSKSSQETHQNSHGLSAPEVKPSVPSKAKPHNPSLPRCTSVFRFSCEIISGFLICLYPFYWAPEPSPFW